MPSEAETNDVVMARRSQVSDVDFIRLLQGAAYSIVQAPLDGTAQMVSKIADLEMTAPQLCHNAAYDNRDGWWQTGEMFGSVISFIALTKVLRVRLNKRGLVHVATPLTAYESALIGSSTALLRPIDEYRGDDDFFRCKAIDVIASAASFGLMTRTNNSFHNGGILGRIGRRSLRGSMLANGLSGALGGFYDTGLRVVLDDPRIEGNHGANIANHAVFGALFGVGEGFLARAHIRNLKLDPKRTSAVVPTEKLIADPSVQAHEFRSPILTWIAENRPGLRPPNYEQVQARIASSASGEVPHFKLGDWPVDRQLLVLREVQKLARRSLMASDANIDAVIKYLPRPELQAFTDSLNRPALRDGYVRWGKASDQLRERVQNDPKLREFPFCRIITDGKLHDKYPELRTLVSELRSAESAYRTLVDTAAHETGIAPALTRTIDVISHDAGLPYIFWTKIEGNSGGAAYGPFPARFRFGDFALGRGKSPEAADSVMHETVHHEQGIPSDWWRMPKRHRHHEAQIHILKDLELLERPGGALDLLQRLGDRQTNTYNYLSAGSGLSRSLRMQVHAVRRGCITEQTLDESEAKKSLRDMLENQLRYHRIKAHESYMQYVGSSSELPAWSVGYITQLRARAAGLTHTPLSDEYLRHNPINASRYFPLGLLDRQNRLSSSRASF